MKCKGCNEVGLHLPNARKCNVCGGELVIIEKNSRKSTFDKKG